MKYKLSKFKGSTIYKGIIIEPQIRDFFIGRVWTRQVTPFPQPKIETYIKQNYFNIKPAISIKQSKGIGKRQIFKCNRCLNENQKEFIRFECARCGKICVYCRHCINMGRMSSCTELLVWNGPTPKLQKVHVLNWKGEFTNLQEKTSDETIKSIQGKRGHLIHAVCGARQN